MKWTFLDYLKKPQKKAPLATLASALVYGIFTAVIDGEPPILLTILIVLLTFLFSIVLLTQFDKKNNSQISNNVMQDINVSNGDAFIGNKSETSSGNKISNNKLSKAKVKDGDAFIGKKSN